MGLSNLPVNIQVLYTMLSSSKEDRALALVILLNNLEDFKEPLYKLMYESIDEWQQMQLSTFIIEANLLYDYYAWRDEYRGTTSDALDRYS